MDLNTFYNQINMCLSAATRLWEDRLPDYKFIKRNYDFEEYFFR